MAVTLSADRILPLGSDRKSDPNQTEQIEMRGTAISAVLLALLLAAIPACEADDSDPADGVAPEEEDPGLQPGWSGRPEEREDTLVAGDLTVPVTLVLYETTGHFPIPFSTYRPDDMEVEEDEMVDGGAAVRFRSLPDEEGDAGVMEFVVYPAGTSTRDAAARARAAAEEIGEIREEPEPVQEWAREEFRFSGGGRVGRVSWGIIEDRPFHLLIHFPPPRQGTFAPKARMVTDSWRWHGDEEPEEMEPPAEDLPADQEPDAP
jgi:hypothetical protein